jgi:transketolase
MVGAPYKDAYKKYEITPEGIAKRAKITIDFWKGIPLLLVCVVNFADVKPIRSPMRKAFEQLI